METCEHSALNWGCIFKNLWWDCFEFWELTWWSSGWVWIQPKSQVDVVNSRKKGSGPRGQCQDIVCHILGPTLDSVLLTLLLPFLFQLVLALGQPSLHWHKKQESPVLYFLTGRAWCLRSLAMCGTRHLVPLYYVWPRLYLSGVVPCFFECCGGGWRAKQVPFTAAVPLNLLPSFQSPLRSNDAVMAALGTGIMPGLCRETGILNFTWLMVAVDHQAPPNPKHGTGLLDANWTRNVTRKVPTPGLQSEAWGQSSTSWLCWHYPSSWPAESLKMFSDLWIMEFMALNKATIYLSQNL